MPKIICLLFFCAFFQYTSAQSIIISGHLPKTKANSVVLTYNATALDFIEDKEQRIEVPLDSEHKFKIRIESKTAVQFNLQEGNHWLLVNINVFPGDSISITKSGSRWNFTGNCENNIAYQDIQKALNFRNFRIGLAQSKAMRKYEAMRFAKYTNHQIEKQLANLQAHHAKHPISKELIAAEKNEILYRNGADFFYYCGGSRKHYLSDSAYLSYIKNLPINNPEALGQNDYLFFMRQLLFFTWNSKVNRKMITEPTTKYYLQNHYKIRDSIARINFTGKVRDYAYYINDYEQIKSLNFHKGKANYDSLEARIRTLTLASKNKYQDSTLYLRLLQRLAEQTQKKLNPAPDFTVKDLQGNPHKLSDYRGKVVYLDFWSTTCAPCVAEIPALNALIEKYKERDVVFLSVAFDADRNRLNRFLEKKPINGTILVEEKGFGSALAGDYQIHSIPRYCVIDKAGYLINDNAPRPGSKPEEIIETALNH